MSQKKPPVEAEEKKIFCPRCGKEMRTSMAVTRGFCGLRMEAECPDGCRLTPEERGRILCEATDALYLF